jgi:integrase
VALLLVPLHRSYTVTTRFARIRRNLTRWGLGRVQIATRARTEREHRRRVVLFDELVEQGQVALIKALLSPPSSPSHLSWEQLIDHRRRQGGRIGADALHDVQLHRDLFAVTAEMAPKLGKAERTRKRYALSLRTAGKLTKDVWPSDPMRVRDLVDVDWPAVRTQWPGKSAADWNNMGRALRVFLTRLVGKPSTFRADVMARFPWEPEAERVPDLTPDVFWRVMGAAAEHVRPAYMTLLLTGMRDQSEYLKCKREHLLPNIHAVRVPGTKTKGSLGVVSVPAALWSWVDSAIPSPVKYKWLRIHWCRACVKAGAGAWSDPENEKGYTGLRMHDLRHALGQWATDQGVPTNVVQDQLRHATEAMTRRYARMANSRQVAEVMGRVVGGER